MCRLRDVFDPDRRANPGKVVPVRYCRERRPNTRMADGGRQMADGGRQTADGRWQTADGGRQTADSAAAPDGTAEPGA
jgi:hypothetical protein